MEKVDKKSVLLIVTIASFLTPFMASSVNVALPIIAVELSVNAILLNWITTSFLLASAIFAVPLGRIADIYGMKRIFILGIILFTIATFLASISMSAQFLIFSRLIQGIGSAMTLVTGLALISSVYPPREMGSALGISTTALFIGLVMGPVLGGILTQYLGWRSIFYLIVPFGILVTFLVIIKLRGIEYAECRGENVDLPGSFLYGISLLLILFGFSMITSFLGIILLILGIIIFIGFVIYELRVEHPVLEMRLFLKNRKFAFSNLAALISFTGTFAVVFLLSLYLQLIKGLDPRGAGIILAVQTFCMALMSPFAGKLSDMYESRILASIGMAMITCGLIIFSFLNADTSFFLIILSLVLLGFGYGVFSTPNTHAVMNSVKKKYFGVASATVSTMRLIGQTMSMGIVLVIFSVYIGAVQFNPSNYPALLQSINVMFTISAFLGFFAIFASLSR